jgi:hypothetical protein
MYKMGKYAMKNIEQGVYIHVSHDLFLMPAYVQKVYYYNAAIISQIYSFQKL